MPQSSTHLYIHLIWATWNRSPLITPNLEGPLHACLAAKCGELRCELLAVGGVEDHLHVLVRLHPDISVARLAKHLKGASSHLMTHEFKQEFKWQGGYGALSISISHVSRVIEYIKHQKEHHAQGVIWPHLEEIPTLDSEPAQAGFAPPAGYFNARNSS